MIEVRLRRAAAVVADAVEDGVAPRPVRQRRDRLLDVLADVILRRAVLVWDPIGEHARAVRRLPPEDRALATPSPAAPGAGRRTSRSRSSRRICGIVALWPNESRFAPVVAVIPNVEQVALPVERLPDERLPAGMLQSGSTHQPPTIWKRPSATCSLIRCSSSGSLSSTQAKKSDESQVKTKSGYSSSRSTADWNVAAPPDSPRATATATPDRCERCRSCAAYGHSAGRPGVDRVDHAVEEEDVQLLDPRRRVGRDDKCVVGMLERRPAVAAAEQDCRGAGRARGSEPADDVRRTSTCREGIATSPSRTKRPHLPLEDLLEGVVVGDARQRRRIRGRATGPAAAVAPA